MGDKPIEIKITRIRNLYCRIKSLVNDILENIGDQDLKIYGPYNSVEEAFLDASLNEKSKFYVKNDPTIYIKDSINI